MGTIKTLITIFLLVAALAMTYVFFRTFISWKQGYSWDEMDWDKNGSTSIGEFIQAGDIGERTTIKHGQKCKEYFSYKDGLPVKTICLN